LVGTLSCYAKFEEGHNPELVMHEGMTITVNTEDGPLRIRAGKGQVRTYEWGSCSKTARLYARPARWYGSLGLYYSGVGNGGRDACRGLDHMVVEEGQQHFGSLEEATAWIHRKESLSGVYNNSGLLVKWAFRRQRGDLDVDVWQVLINGSKPASLDGADDGAVSVSDGGR
jgi:hypothetical protein